MRRGGKILGEILLALASETRPGISTLDLEQKAQELYKKYSVAPSFKGYHGYPAILCTSVNNEVVHAIPDKKILNPGDILSIDAGVFFEGFHTDSAIAIIVGDQTKLEIKKFVNTCIAAMWNGIHQVKPGNRIHDISAAIEETVESAGYSIIPDLTGHGIGRSLHEEPFVPNFTAHDQGPVLQPGMTIAIEPIISMGSPNIETLDDGWTIVTKDNSLAIQHEHTVLVTETGVEILTLRPGEQTF